jgi:phosphotriesterase-related protein
MTPAVMTVLGPVEAGVLGVTLPHEHILCDLWRVTRDPRHFMIDAPLAVEEVGLFKTAGGGTIVDCTTRQFGRDPAALRAIARATGVHVVMGCGWYREPFYDRSVYEGSVAGIAAAIEREILDGVDGTGVRPGIIGEIGTDLHYISPAEERVFRAVARVQRRTGKPLLAAYGGTGYGYVLTEFVPRLLAAGLSREQVQLMLVDNPRRALTGERATLER